MNSFEDLYRYCYNILVEISNGEVLTIHYLFSKKWKVCKLNDTVKIAYDAIVYMKQFSKEIKNWKEDKILVNKISKMIDTLNEIAKAKPDEWDDGLFNVVKYYYAEDTVFKAQKCLKILNEYI